MGDLQGPLILAFSEVSQFGVRRFAIVRKPSELVRQPRMGHPYGSWLFFLFVCFFETARGYVFWRGRIVYLWLADSRRDR